MRPSEDWSDSCDDLDGVLFQGLVNSGRVLKELGRVAMTVSGSLDGHSISLSLRLRLFPQPPVIRKREDEDDEKEGFRG